LRLFIVIKKLIEKKRWHFFTTTAEKGAGREKVAIFISACSDIDSE
jgi:hypothetical protein